MVATVADFVILPNDGLPPRDADPHFVRTLVRQRGANQVHDRYVVMSRERQSLGHEYLSTGTLSVQAAAQNGTTSAFWWLYVPQGVSFNVAIARVEFLANITSASAMLSLPRILLNRFEHTGGAPSDTALGFVTSSAGLSPVLQGGPARAFLPPVGQGAGVSGVMDTCHVWEPALERDQMLLQPGEGVVCYQPDAGTASDSRRFVMNITAEYAAQP